MSESQDVVRVTLSLPRELARRVEAFKDWVDWSAVAQEAFEKKFLALAGSKTDKAMEEVVARLRAAEEQEAASATEQGRQAGERWAKGTAAPAQLRRLKEVDATMGVGWAALHGYQRKHPAGIAGGLFETIEGPGSKLAHHGEFWAGIIGPSWKETIGDLDFALAFCEAAIRVWDDYLDAV